MIQYKVGILTLLKLMPNFPLIVTGPGFHTMIIIFEILFRGVKGSIGQSKLEWKVQCQMHLAFPLTSHKDS